MDATVITALATGGLTALVTIVGTYFGARTSQTAEAAERQRLSSEVLGYVPTSVTTDVQSAETTDTGTDPNNTSVDAPASVFERSVSSKSAAWRLNLLEAWPSQATLLRGDAAARDAAYARLLIDDYALGLTQARRAFNVSMAFSILGGLVLVVGVGLAIFRADTGGQVTAAAITSATGVLTAGLSQLFRGQPTKALKHLETQTIELRKDVREHANIETALRLLVGITEAELENRLKAALILQFTGASLPDLAKVPQAQPKPRGSRLSNRVTEPSSPSS